MAFSATGCGGKHNIVSNNADPERTFTYFIPKQDGVGVGGSYDSYDQNPSILYLTKDPFTYKNKEGQEVTNNVALRFSAATLGQEPNGFITNLDAGVDILDMDYATETARTMYQNGKLMDLTYWVENYMPNYLAMAKKFGIDDLIATRDEKGNKQYLQLYSIYENVNWQYYGYQYRQDWVLEYGKTFDANGTIGAQTFKEAHPDWGWNTVDGQKVWQDEILFPSWYGLQYNNDGKNLGTGTFTYSKELYDYMHGEYIGHSEARATELETALSHVERDFDIYHGQWPATISDWEWMLDIFQVAVNAEFKDRGYPMALYQFGYVPTGNLVSSFGGTGGEWQKYNGNVILGTDKSCFKVYVDTMNKWYSNGYIDNNFQTNDDLLWRTDEANVRQGYVGLYFGMNDQLFDGMDIGAGHTQGIYTLGMPYPINDKYGDAENKYQTPKTLYAANYESNSVMISTAAKNKDLAALFTMLDAAYTDKAGAAKSWGLTKEMLEESQEGVQDLYKKLGYPEGTVQYDEATGKYFRREDALDVLMDDQYVVSSRRMLGLEGAVLGKKQTRNDQYENYIWNYYPDEGFLTKSFYALFNGDQYSLYTDKVGQLRNSLSADIPKFIKGDKKMSEWNGWYSSLKSKLILDTITEMIDAKYQTIKK